MRITLPNILVIVAVVILGAVGSAYVTSWFFQQQDTEASKEVLPQNSSVIGAVVHIDNLTADLRTVNRSTAFVRANVTIEVPDRRTATELEEREYRLRDAIIAVLRSFTADEVEAEEGAERMKQEIKNAIDPLLSRGETLGVFFTELVVQR